MKDLAATEPKLSEMIDLAATETKLRERAEEEAKSASECYCKAPTADSGQCNNCGLFQSAARYHPAHSGGVKEGDAPGRPRDALIGHSLELSW